MNTRNKINLQISDLTIAINCEKSLDITRYLKRDFDFFEVNSALDGNVDIYVEIVDELYTPPTKSVIYDDTIHVYDNVIAFKYSAKLRSVWVEFQNTLDLGSRIKIYMPKEYIQNSTSSRIRESIIRLIFPNYLFRWQNILLDVFHGPFLGLIHMHLLKNGYGLIHASAVSNLDGKGLMFPGWGQSGKSTIADILIDKKGWNFIGEDLCIIDNKNVLSFPKQRGVYFNQLNKKNTYKAKVSNMERFQERTNFWTMKLLKPLFGKGKRVLSWDEIYDEKTLIGESKIKTIIFVARSNDNEIKISRIESEQCAKMCSNMMMAEMLRLNRFFELLSVYAMHSEINDVFGNLYNQTYEAYMKSFTERNCYLLEVPKLENIEVLEEWLIQNIEKIK